MRILITAPYDEDSLKNLEDKLNATIIYHPWKEHGTPFKQNEVLELITKYKVDGIITELDEIDEVVIEKSEQLKFIGVCRANPVNVDIEAARKKNIIVFNTPGRNSQAVAELLVGTLISFYRNIIESNIWLKKGEWNEDDERPYIKFRGNEIAGKTIGFVGFGAVGQKVAKILKEFSCKIQFYDPYITEYSNEYDNVSLDYLFESSDVVSIHLPVVKSTHQMINTSLLSKMKKNAVFINTARSAVVDYNALYNMLLKKEIKGAILDVFENEPLLESDYKLIKLPHVLATPHIAGASFEVEKHHSIIMNNNITSYYVNGVKKNVFNLCQ